MRGVWMKRAAWAIVVAAGLAGLVWFAWPRPVLVDLAAVARGPMEVTVEDDGKTNVRTSIRFQRQSPGRCSESHTRPGRKQFLFTSATK
jgi:hypothetical protein